MKKFPIIIGVITILVIVLGVILISRNEQKSQVSIPSFPPVNAELFFGNGCPHCKIVDDFINSWSQKDKVKIDRFEIWYNRGNANIMKDHAAKCGLDINNLGVPLMVTPEGKCINGDEPIITYLKQVVDPTPTPSPTKPINK